MTANTSPIFALTPVVGKVAISTANINRDGTGALGTIITGGTNGTRITRIRVQAYGTVTAGVVRLYITGGGTTHLYREIMVTATTPSTSVQAWSYTIDLPGEFALVLPASYVLAASTNNGEGFNVFAEGGDY